MIKAVLFDMDGVIANTEPIHGLSTKKVLGNLNISAPDFDFNDYLGIPEKETWIELIKKYEIKEDIDTLLDMKSDIFQNLLITQLKPTQGLSRFLKNLQDNNIKTALVSSSGKDMIDAVIKVIGYNDYFDSIVSCDDVQDKKPHPEPYLTALKKLNVSPIDSVVIEDTPIGIKSSKNAGIKCIAILSNFDKESLKEADYFIETFDDLDFDIINKVIKNGHN